MKTIAVDKIPTKSPPQPIPTSQIKYVCVGFSSGSLVVVSITYYQRKENYQQLKLNLFWQVQGRLSV